MMNFISDFYNLFYNSINNAFYPKFFELIYVNPFLPFTSSIAMSYATLTKIISFLQLQFLIEIVYITFLLLYCKDTVTTYDTIFGQGNTFYK